MAKVIGYSVYDLVCKYFMMEFFIVFILLLCRGVVAEPDPETPHLSILPCFILLLQFLFIYIAFVLIFFFEFCTLEERDDYEIEVRVLRF